MEIIAHATHAKVPLFTKWLIARHERNQLLALRLRQEFCNSFWIKARQVMFANNKARA
jgi:hypothetical protein